MKRVRAGIYVRPPFRVERGSRVEWVVIQMLPNGMESWCTTEPSLRAAREYIARCLA